MSDSLEDIRQSCEKIKAATFERPGAFTNAFLSDTRITSLLRDFLPGERGLYKITKGTGVASTIIRRPRKGLSFRGEGNDTAFDDIKPVRIDGKSVFTDHDSSLNLRKAVEVPRLISNHQNTPELGTSSDTFSSPVRKSRTPQPKAGHNATEKQDLPSICTEIESIADLWPGSEGASAMKQKADVAREEYHKLRHEIEALEHTIEQQKHNLGRHHENLQELSPSRGLVSPTKSHSIDELIRQEEEKIMSLEKELGRATNEKRT